VSETDTHTDEAAIAGHTRGSKVSSRFTLAVCLLLVLGMCAFWLISNYNTQNLLRQQADELGSTVAEQTALQMTEFVLANDRISMNVVLGELIRGTSITELAVINTDNEIIAIATQSLPRPSAFIPLPIALSREQADYEAPISLRGASAGSIRLVLDLSAIEVTIINNLLMVVALAALLVIVAIVLTTTYFSYLISFPVNLLADALANIRNGVVEASFEPEGNDEIARAVREYNQTAEFLAQNTFLDRFSRQLPEFEPQRYTEPGRQEVAVLCLKMSNFTYLGSTLPEDLFVNLRNKFYFFAGKVSEMYNGTLNSCTNEEVIIHFGESEHEEEQAFYAICAGQLFLRLVEEINLPSLPAAAALDEEGQEEDEALNWKPERTIVREREAALAEKEKQRAQLMAEIGPLGAKFALATHSGSMLRGIYSPITHATNSLSGETLDQARALANEAPDNSLLISEPCYEAAGDGSRLDAHAYLDAAASPFDFEAYLSLEPLSDYRLLLDRQAHQLIGLWSQSPDA
jgi:uncharacterized membrane protein affecting hemolysin expression/class 3 adenylate cyclase